MHKERPEVTLGEVEFWVGKLADEQDALEKEYSRIGERAIALWAAGLLFVSGAASLIRANGRGAALHAQFGALLDLCPVLAVVAAVWLIRDHVRKKAVSAQLQNIRTEISERGYSYQPEPLGGMRRIRKIERR